MRECPPPSPPPRKHVPPYLSLVCPLTKILEIKNELLNLGAEGSLLSGSGSTVFGIFENPEIAKKALARFTGKKYRVCLAKSITRFSEFFPEEMISAF